MKRLLPSPLLSFFLFLLWLLLNQSVSAGNLLLAAILAILAPRLTIQLRPSPVRIRRPLSILKLVTLVTADLLRSNVAVAWIVLTKRDRELRSSFVQIPLEVRDPNALAVLCAIVCATPGTAWGEVAYDRSSLLIHTLDLKDPEDVRDTIKNRYEKLLREIFE